MLEDVPLIKIHGACVKGEQRPPIWVLLDVSERRVELRRVGNRSLDPLDAAFTIAEAHGLREALEKLLPKRSAESSEESEGEQGDREAESDSSYG